MTSHVARWSDGRFALSPLYAPPQVASYDLRGAFERSFQRIGGGPGELAPGMLGGIGMRGDTLFVLSVNKIVAFEPGLRPVRTVMLPMAPTAFVPLQGGGFAVRYPLNREDGRFVLHMLDEAGAVRHSVDRRARGDRGLVDRVLAPSRDGGFWAAHRGASRIDHYSAAGRLVRTLELPAAWSAPSRDDERRGAPSPRVTALRELDDGRLLVLREIPSADWRPVEGALSRDRDLNPYFDTVLAVVDPASGQEVASYQGRGILALVSGVAPMVAAMEMQPSGDIQALVWHVDLRAPAGR